MSGPKSRKYQTPVARKRFGQNFLTDAIVIERIIDSINPQTGELIIEIGPGHAALTIPLITSGADIHCLEIDRDIAVRLKPFLLPYANAELHVGDALKTDFSQISSNRNFRLVGNLPYNISTPLLFHVLQWSHLIEDMHFMLQKEVVNRMAATPGSKAWGRLSIMCQYHCQVMPLFTVPPDAFTPAPKVQSSIVRLIPHETPPVAIENMPVFEHLVRTAFNMRRKTLRNSLKSLLDSSQIESVGIDPSLRPESLSMKDFSVLAKLIDLCSVNPKR